MTDEQPKSPILETTEDAIKAAKTMLRLARFGAICTLEPETGFPFVTRTNVAVTMAGNPVFLMSDLAAHTKAIKNDARTSLLVGEPGKGDPLAHPRLILIGDTKAVPRESETEQQAEKNVRQRYINRHPKAELYNSLPDFFLYELNIERALFNAGFGKAYELTGEELCLNEDSLGELPDVERRIVDHMNEDHSDAIEFYAVGLCGKKPGPAKKGWRITSCDPDGVDMMEGDNAARLDFETPCTSATEVREALVAYAKQARS